MGVYTITHKKPDSLKQSKVCYPDSLYFSKIKLLFSQRGDSSPYPACNSARRRENVGVREADVEAKELKVRHRNKSQMEK